MSIYNQEKIFYIYVYLRSHKSIYGDIGTPYYVGKGTGRRLFSKDRNVYKPINDEHIYVYADNLIEDDAFFLEIMLIARYGRIDLGTGCLRNRTDGGEGSCGFKFSEIDKQRMSEKIKQSGRDYSGVNNPRYGKSPHEYMSDIQIKEYKEIRSKKYSGQGNPMYGKYGKDNPNFGREVTDEFRLKMSKQNLGRKQTTEHRNNSSIAQKQKRWIYNPKTDEAFVIHKDQLKKYMDDGWVNQMKPSIVEKRRARQQGNRWIINLKTHQRKVVSTNDLEKYVLDGWKLGVK